MSEKKEKDLLFSGTNYQAKKFEGSKYEEIIRKTNSPGEAKRLSWSRELRSSFRKDDWDELRFGYMKNAIKAKFIQNEGFVDLLLGTGNRKIVEDAPGDSYWGNGINGKGQNKLGVIFMELRDEFRKQKLN